jgi:hypothetical protein
MAQNIPSRHSKPDTVQDPFSTLANLIIAAVVRVDLYCLHFTDEKVEVKRCQITCLSLQGL